MKILRELIIEIFTWLVYAVALVTLCVMYGIDKIVKFFKHVF